jgi:hypothetical protein
VSCAFTPDFQSGPISVGLDGVSNREMQSLGSSDFDFQQEPQYHESKSFKFN